MRLQAAAYLEKAGEALDDARRNKEIGIARQAARLAYYAAFHAAQALIFERQGKAAKTHKGANAQFAKIVVGEALSAELPQFLATTYHFKAAADYETGTTRVITADEARQAIVGAEKFIEAVRVVLNSEV